MDKLKVGKKLLVAAVILVAGAVAFYGGTVARGYLGADAAAAAAELEPAGETEADPQVVARRVWVGEEEQGVLEIGGETVLQVQTTSGGLTGYERAMIMAKRINDELAAGTEPDEVAAEQMEGQWMVLMAQMLLVAVNDAEADAVGRTPHQLAEHWASNITYALSGLPSSEETAPQPSAESGEPEETEEGEPIEEDLQSPQTSEEAAGEPEQEPEPEPTEETGEEAVVPEAGWQSPEPYKNKIVPIVSVLEGIRIGVARINGPQSAVDQVQAVAQLETHYRDMVEIDVYVPISTKVPGQTLARVQGVGVTGLGDYRF